MSDPPRRGVRTADIEVRFGSHQALDGLDLALGTGVHGLLGPNGAGKTTLMRVLATVLTPHTGTVDVLGWNALDRAERQQIRGRMGYLPQTFGYYPRFTVREFVEYFAWLKQMPRATVPKAIVNDPHILLLDEPTAGLDPEQRVQFRTLLRRIGADNCVLVSTHLVEDVATACTTVHLMDTGRVVYAGTPQELIEMDADGAGDTPIERGYTTVLRRARGEVETP